MQLFTKVISSGNTLTLVRADNVAQVTISVPTGGAGSIKGTAQAFQGQNTNDALPLAPGDSFTLQSRSGNDPLELIIACTGGSIRVAIGF